MSTVDMTTPASMAGHHRLACRTPRLARSRGCRWLLLSAGHEARRSRPNISPVISRARCASTSTRLPTTPIRCRTCCRMRSSSRMMWAPSASPIATRSWSMTAAGFLGRRGCGGLFGCSAQRKSSSSTAACRSGRRGPPAGEGSVARPPRLFRARKPTRGRVASLERVRDALTSHSAQVVDARPGDRFRASAGAAAGRALRPYAGRPQRASSESSRTAGSPASRRSGPRLQLAASISTGRSSRAAAPASRPPPCGSRSMRSARSRRRSTTARGRNGARARIVPIKP